MSHPRRASSRRKDNATDWYGLGQVAAVLVLCGSVWIAYKTRKAANAEWAHVEDWLQQYNLQQYKLILYDNGVRNLDDVMNIDFLGDPQFSGLASSIQLELNRAARSYMDAVVLEEWLKDQGLSKYYARLHAAGIRSVEALASSSPSHLASLQKFSLVSHDYEDLLMKVEQLKLDMPSYRRLRDKHWHQFLSTIDAHKWTVSGLIMVLLISGLVMALINTDYASYIAHHPHSKRSVVDFVTGKYLSPHHCKVVWDWNEPQVVGGTVSFRIKFYQRNGRPYKISEGDMLLVEVMIGSMKIPNTVTYASSSAARPSSKATSSSDGSSNHSNVAKVSFTVHKSGQYKIVVMVAASPIKGSPFSKTFLPGAIDPAKTGFVNQSSVVICTRGVPHQMHIEPRDEYGNLCADPKDSVQGYSISLIETGQNEFFEPQLHVTFESVSQAIGLELCIEQEGCYKASATYRGLKLKNGDFSLLVLSPTNASQVHKSVAKKSHNIYYEARLLSCNHQKLDKAKKIYCYISPKQLTIKEYFMKIFPKRLYTFRVCPSTKFQFLGRDNHYDAPILLIEDGCQPPVQIATKDRNVIAAVFTIFLLKNIGGSETFKDKQDFFYHEVRQLHSKRLHERLPIKINRMDLLKTSMKATKNFSTSDWCKSFEIHFVGEEGVDWGGLRREWIELLSQALFEPGADRLFTKFKDDNQALVHPNPCPANLKLKHYEFAGRIVGKCLYESALGGSYKQFIKARFSRSFLAQLIGLRVNYKYFEQDDPELYNTKIKYIEENDVEDMELVFAEEEYHNGKLERVVELLPNGSRTPVTNGNKMEYLDALAQYKLARSVQEEIEAFLKGLNELIPDNLLSIFDENELELLICGTSNYSITEFRNNHIISGSSPEFAQVLEWFWVIVSGFTQEDMARLLQFTTGCSLLPPGGFAELNPKFQITAAPTYGSLPTAHTCFNQICLPIYQSLEEMHTALIIALREGNQGFAMI